MKTTICRQGHAAPGAASPQATLSGATRPRLTAALCATAALAAVPRAAAMGPLTETQVALFWPILAGLAFLAAAATAAVLQRRLAQARAEGQALAAELKADNNKLYRQLQTYGSELSGRERQLAEAREALELSRQETSDLQALVNQRLQRALDALRSTLNLLARGCDKDNAGLVDMAKKQLAGVRDTIGELTRQKDSPAAEEPAAANEESNVPRLSVMLVQHEDRDGLQERLGLLGHRVTSADSGADAVEAARQGVFDLVMIDSHLKLTDCRDVARRIRRELGRELPVFALVDGLTPGERERYQAGGMTGVLPRPVPESHLRQLLNWTAHRARHRKSGESKKNLRPSRLLNTGMLREKRDILGHLPFAELVSNRVATLPKRMSALTSALTGRHWIDAEKLALLAAAQSEEMGLEAVAQQLKSLAKNLSIDSEREYCRHQRTELLSLMRASVQQLKAWREQNVHTAWALK